ncbi:MAG: hypothetical protein ACFFDY_00255 [Candidatus Thorarchaeota archaeon]
MFKPIALIYPEKAKRPLFIGYFKNEKDGLYTVQSSFRTVKSGLSSLKEVCAQIEWEFGDHPDFKWMPLFNANSLII